MNNELITKINIIKGYISSNKLEQAFEQLEVLVLSHGNLSGIEKEIIVLQNSYNSLKQRRRLGLAINENAESRIVFSLLEILTVIQDGSATLNLDNVDVKPDNRLEDNSTFFQKNRIPVLASGAAIVIVVSLNSLNFGMLILGVFLILFFIKDFID